MDNLKQWLLEQIKAEEKNGQTPKWWRLKEWIKRVNMAEFKSTELCHKDSGLDEAVLYEKFVTPIKEEIKFWNK